MDRACSRCITKKRKCNHARPSCELCIRAGEQCQYPESRKKRGPIPGQNRVIDGRMSRLEDALYFVLGVPGVGQAIRAHSATQLTLPTAPTVDCSRSERYDWYSSTSLETVGDVLGFRRQCEQAVGDGRLSEQGIDHLGNAESGGGGGSAIYPSPTPRSIPTRSPTSTVAPADLLALVSPTNHTTRYSDAYYSQPAGSANLGTLVEAATKSTADPTFSSDDWPSNPLLLDPSLSTLAESDAAQLPPASTASTRKNLFW